MVTVGGRRQHCGIQTTMISGAHLRSSVRYYDTVDGSRKNRPQIDSAVNRPAESEKTTPRDTAKAHMHPRLKRRPDFDQFLGTGRQAPKLASICDSVLHTERLARLEPKYLHSGSILLVQFVLLFVTHLSMRSSLLTSGSDNTRR